MAEMRAAAGAKSFLTTHPVARIQSGLDALVFDSGPEAGPAGPRIVLGCGCKEWRVAHHTAIDAIRLVVDIDTGKWWLGRTFLRHRVLLRVKVRQVPILVLALIHFASPVKSWLACIVQSLFYLG